MPAGVAGELLLAVGVVARVANQKLIRWITFKEIDSLNVFLSPIRPMWHY